MKQDSQLKQQPNLPATTPIRSWLLGSIITMLLLVAAATLCVPLLISSNSVKQKIQAAVTEQTGGKVDYQGIDFSYLPRLAIELRLVTLTIPDQAQGTIEALRISPKLLPLLTGRLQLARLELDTPQLSLKLSDTKPKEIPVQPYTFTTLEKNFSAAIEPLVQMISSLKLVVNNGQITITQGERKLSEARGLNMQLSMSMTYPHSGQANLLAKLSELSIYRNDHQETVKDISLNGSIQKVSNKVTVTLNHLSLAEPSLELTGELALTKIAPAITLSLSASNIDVDATRRMALALAGDTTPIKQIFGYLGGGRIPQINFSSHGENPSDLGDLNNILIKGQLQDGKVSIPGIKLDLTEVSGDVLISKAVLQGTGLSTRLARSTGQDGSFKIGLAEGNDLFQLELMLNADLAETLPILKHVIRDPTFIREMDKITTLQGSGYGRLTLGDSLNDIKTKVEVSELKLSADYQRVPLPIHIAQAQLAYSNGQIDLGKIRGTLGQSQFTDLSCQILWEKDLSLDISSGQVDLVMTELYPWLASLEGLRDQLQEVTQVTGQLEVATIELKGALDKPSEWRITSSGTVKDLSVDTKLFPDTINFASGGFKVDKQQLSFEKLQTASQDAVISLSGSLKNFPQQLHRIEMSLDGNMGPQSVKWLSDTLNIPETYAIRAPLSFSNTQISWQPDSTASFKGDVFIGTGPTITADVDYYPQQLQVHQLTIKDQYSDVNMVFDSKKDQRDIKFTGKLQYETLQNLFVKSPISSGRLEGEFAVTVPQTGQSKITTKGQLRGQNLPVLFPSGDKVDIDQVMLQGDGAQILVDITKLTGEDLTWNPVKATISLNRDGADISLTEAKLCGINSTGTISIARSGTSLNLTLEGKGLNVASSYTCLTDGRVKMTGTLDFSSQITVQRQKGKLINALQGPLDMTFSNGVVEQDKLISRALEVLNVTEIVKGRLPNLDSKGFAYTTMTVQGEFQNDKLVIHKYFMDGETLDLLGKGEIRQADKTLDIKFLAMPFKTVDSIVKQLPGVNYLLAGNLVAIPISVTGALADPKVEVMPTSAIGSNLYDLAKRTIDSPFKLIESINPWAK